jgi:MFS family permease
VVSAVALAAFVLIEWRTEQPMFDLGPAARPLVHRHPDRGLLVNFAAFSAFTYTSIWLQSVLGLSPLRAGLVGLPMSVCAALASGVVGARLHGRSPRLIIGLGMLLIGAGSLLLGLLVDADAGWLALIPGYLVIGLGVGLVMPTLSSSAMAAVPLRSGGMAAGSLTTARQLGFAIGVAILGTVFASRVTDHLGSSAAGHAVAGGQAARLSGQIPEAAIRSAAAAGLDAGYLISGAVGIVCALVVFALVRPVRPGPVRSPPASRRRSDRRLPGNPGAARGSAASRAAGASRGGPEWFDPPDATRESRAAAGGCSYLAGKRRGGRRAVGEPSGVRANGFERPPSVSSVRRVTERRAILSGSTFEEQIGYAGPSSTATGCTCPGTTGFDYRTMTIPDDVVLRRSSAWSMWVRRWPKRVVASLMWYGCGICCRNGRISSRAGRCCGRTFGEVRPAATMMVCGLADPRMKIEIEVYARRRD